MNKTPILKSLIGWCIFMSLTTSPGHASVPAPYTPVQATETEFRCLGRATKLGPMLLPTQITSARRQLLSSPIRIVADQAMEGLTGSGRLIRNDGNSASWEWRGESKTFYVASKMTADCDGFSWYEIKLTPKQPVKLSSVRLDIPRKEPTARYLHAAGFEWGAQTTTGLPEYGGNWTHAFMPYVWLGDEDRGLGWCAESDQGWQLSERANALQVKTQGDVVTFGVNLLDHEETIDSPITLSFGLQATPVKPVSFAWRAKARICHYVTYESDDPDANGVILLDIYKDVGVKTVVYHDMWPEYYGQIKPEKEEEFRKLIDECHKRGLNFLVYVGYGVARNAPEIQGHHDEWSVMPLISWEPDYKPEYRSFDADCARSGWGTWLVKSIDKLFNEYDIDGLYFDGTSEAWKCQNELHGCGYRDKDGNLHPTYPMLDVRNLMRKIAEVVRKHRPNGILDVHMSASLTVPTLSFCDSYWDGEQYQMYTSADNVEIPLDAFRAEFMGWAHGLDAQFLCYVDNPFSTEEAIALAWLHGVEVRPGGVGQLDLVSPIWRAMDRFDAPSAKWLPYWKGSGVTAHDSSVKASAWVKDGKALIFVSHLKREPLTTTLRLDCRKLGLKQSGLTAVDALSGEALKVEGSSVPIDFSGMTYRLIELR